MRISGLGAAAAVAVLAVLALAPAAIAGPVEDSQELRDELNLAGMTEHMQKLQAIANAHQGNRAAGTVGYEQSVSYVADRLEGAGYDVRLSPFDFPEWEENSTPELEQVTPTPTTYVAGGPEDADSPDVDFITFQFSGSGDVTAPVVPTNDIVLPPAPEPNTSTSGCEPGDFPAATTDSISLVQRGTCPFVQKLDNAEAAGAVGVILFNEGQALPGRQNAQFAAATPYLSIPAVFASTSVGEDFYEAFEAGDDPTARLAVDATTSPQVQYNVIAESPWGDPEHAVVTGAHLDSVPAGPGINDNGSGTAATLEIAEEMAELKQQADAGVADAEAKLADAMASVDAAQAEVDKREAKKAKAKRKLKKADGKKERKKAKRKLKKARKKLRDARDDLTAAEQALATAQEELETAKQRFDPKHQLRIAYWGAEESGLIGSSQYVAQLTEAERNAIMLNLNFDMLASPNFVRFVYDGNTDETEPPPDGAPAGSDVIEQVFLDYFASQGLPTEPTAFDGRSDYGPFIAEGIPAGGLFSGAEQPKQPEEVAVYGGVAGEQYDPCYHEGCDTFDSVFGAGPPGLPTLAGNGATSLDQLGDAAAHATHHFVTEESPLPARATKRREAHAAYGLEYRGPLLNR
jgi:Zn-dependent M28 family amino/carboxypeptidase